MHRSLRTPRRAKLVVSMLVSTVALMLVVVSSACGQPTTSLTVVLESGGTTASAPSAVRLTIRPLDGDPEVFSPVALNPRELMAISTEQMTSAPFFIDVWGCPSEGACAVDDVVARGCSDVLTLQPHEDAVADVVLRGGDLSACPASEQSGATSETGTDDTPIEISVDGSRL